MKTCITAESWNGTSYAYNVMRDTWINMDDMRNTGTMSDYEATEANIEQARECAEREKFACLNITIRAIV